MKISTSISFLSITISNISHMETAKVRRMTKKLHFWLSESFKNAFLQCLNDPSCTGNSAGCYKTLSAITICIIKSIQETKLQIMAKILLFGTLDHSKMQFCDFWMIQHVPYCSQIVNTILHYHNMQYQVDPTDLSPKNDQNPPFWHFGSFKNAFWEFLNDPSWPGSVAECWKTYSSTKICNIKSIQQT